MHFIESDVGTFSHDILISGKVVLILMHGADPDEMIHFVVFHQDLLLRVISIKWVKRCF